MEGYVGARNDFNCCKLSTGCGTENAQKMLEEGRLAWKLDLKRLGELLDAAVHDFVRLPTTSNEQSTTSFINLTSIKDHTMVEEAAQDAQCRGEQPNPDVGRSRGLKNFGLPA